MTGTHRERAASPPSPSFTGAAALRRTRLALLALFAAAAALGNPVPSFAHTGEAVRLEPGQVPPGGSIRVDGTAFAPDDVATITLVVAGQVVPLGSTRTDGAGSFSLVVTLPASTGDGTYEVRVEVAGDAATASVVVVGQPVDTEPGGLPGQDEPLLGSAPVGGSGLAGPTPNPGHPAGDQSAVQPGAEDGLAVVGGPLLVGLVVLLAVALLVARLARFRRSR